MDLRVPITISDELSDEVVKGSGSLDLASGDIDRIQYDEWNVAERGLPWESDDYEFTSGTLSHQGKDVEFSVTVNRTSGRYSVTPSELLEIKLKAAQLFAGVTGQELLAGAQGKGETKAGGAAPPRSRRQGLH